MGRRGHRVAAAEAPMIALLLAGALSLSTPDLTCRVRSGTGQIVRSMSRRQTFRRLTGYPTGRTGYVVDHIVPLGDGCGGADLPSNMQWLSLTEWKAKTAWERRDGCKPWWNGTYTRLLQHAINGCADGTTPRELCDALPWLRRANLPGAPRETGEARPDVSGLLFGAASAKTPALRKVRSLSQAWGRSVSDLPESASGPLLATSAQDSGLLGMDRVQTRRWIRAAPSPRRHDSGAPLLVGVASRPDTRRAMGASPLRQPALRQAGASIPWRQPGQSGGQRREAATLAISQERVSERARLFGRDYVSLARQAPLHSLSDRETAHRRILRARGSGGS
jgi:hypothetical protein